MGAVEDLLSEIRFTLMVVRKDYGPGMRFMCQ